MKTQITLESKEIRMILARFFGVPETQIIPLRYSYAIEGMSADEVARRISGEVPGK